MPCVSELCLSSLRTAHRALGARPWIGVCGLKWLLVIGVCGLKWVRSVYLMTGAAYLRSIEVSWKAAETPYKLKKNGAAVDGWNFERRPPKLLCTAQTFFFQRQLQSTQAATVGPEPKPLGSFHKHFSLTFFVAFL